MKEPFANKLHVCQEEETMICFTTSMFYPNALGSAHGKIDVRQLIFRYPAHPVTVSGRTFRAIIIHMGSAVTLERSSEPGVVRARTNRFKKEITMSFLR